MPNECIQRGQAACLELYLPTYLGQWKGFSSEWFFMCCVISDGHLALYSHTEHLYGNRISALVDPPGLRLTEWFDLLLPVLLGVPNPESGETLMTSGLPLSILFRLLWLSCSFLEARLKRPVSSGLIAISCGLSTSTRVPVMKRSYDK